MTQHPEKKAALSAGPVPCDMPDLEHLLAQDRETIAAAVRSERDNSIGYLNAIAHKLLLGKLAERLGHHGVTPGQWAALVVLWECDDIVQKDLAERMAIESATLTRTLDRMERDGFVKRHRDKEDRRRVRVQVTDKGLGLINTLVPEALDTIAHATRDLTQDETLLMRNLLKRVIHNIDDRHPAGIVTDNGAPETRLAEAGE